MRAIVLTVLAGVLTAGGAFGAARAADEPAPRPVTNHTVVFDFFCKAEPDWGKDLSEKLRIRLARHDEYDVVDHLTTRDFAPPTPAEADLAKVRKLMTLTFACNKALWGTVHKSGRDVKVIACLLDLTDPTKPAQWNKTFANTTMRAGPVIAREIVEAIRGEKEWVPPQYGDEQEPQKFGKPENVNGSFDAGRKGWEVPDGVGTFLVKGPRGRGTVLRVRTDLARDPWMAWRRKWRLGTADLRHPPKVPRDTSMGGVAGLEGVHYRSDYIKSTPGWRYWLCADVISPGGSMIFIKGFIDWTKEADGLPERSLVERKLTARSFAKLPEKTRKAIIRADAALHPKRYRREVYRWYMNCGGANTWKHVAAPFPPRGGMMDKVQWFRIEIYSFWPPGEYFYDKVFVYKKPGQTKPIGEEKPRTPHYKTRTDEREELKPKPDAEKE